MLEEKKVKIIVRSIDALPNSMKHNDRLIITESNLLDMTHVQLKDQVQDCHTVACCLGHNLNIKGMFGRPHRLVINAVQRLCCAIEATAPTMFNKPIKFILMNTTGNQNTHASEEISISQAFIVGLIRFLLPPHADNEDAASYLQSRFGSHQKLIEWWAMRPDSLINEGAVTEY
ncbi:MAG: hypothetical protein ACI87J_002215 [Colwellia sp.]